jgi:uncharacterized membrane protein
VSAVIERGQTPAALGLGVGLMGLGVLSVVHRDFALQWQPVPADIPGREVLGMISGLILICAGLLLLVSRTRAWGAAIAAAFIGAWVLGLHLPEALAHPANLPGWLGIGETLAMTMGAFVLFREQRSAEARDRYARAAIPVFGVTLVMFGISHFLFAKFTAAMIPDWLPMRLALAYLTGSIHALAGLVILGGRWRRIAAAAEAAMMTSFVLLVHLPRVAAHPTDRLELTMLFVAIALSSAAWGVATARVVRPQHSRTTGSRSR